jgi:hypothetical protein
MQDSADPDWVAVGWPAPDNHQAWASIRLLPVHADLALVRSGGDEGNPAPTNNRLAQTPEWIRVVLAPTVRWTGEIAWGSGQIGVPMTEQWARCNNRTRAFASAFGFTDTGVGVLRVEGANQWQGTWASTHLWDQPNTLWWSLLQAADTWSARRLAEQFLSPPGSVATPGFQEAILHDTPQSPQSLALLHPLERYRDPWLLRTQHIMQCIDGSAALRDADRPNPHHWDAIGLDIIASVVNAGRSPPVTSGDRGRWGSTNHHHYKHQIFTNENRL